MKLTKRQQEELENLKENGTIYVGYNSSDIMRTYNKLVEKGYAKIIGENTYGITYKHI